MYCYYFLRVPGSHGIHCYLLLLSVENKRSVVYIRYVFCNSSEEGVSLCSWHVAFVLVPETWFSVRGEDDRLHAVQSSKSSLGCVLSVVSISSQQLKEFFDWRCPFKVVDENALLSVIPVPPAGRSFCVSLVIGDCRVER